MGQNTGKLVTYTSPAGYPESYHQNDEDNVWDTFHSAHDSHSSGSSISSNGIDNNNNNNNKICPDPSQSTNSSSSPHDYDFQHANKCVPSGEAEVNYTWHVTIKEVPVSLGKSDPLVDDPEEQNELQKGLLRNDVNSSRVQQNTIVKKCDSTQITTPKRHTQPVTRNRSTPEEEQDEERSVTEKSNLLQLSDAET
ncbi:hypothetical protein D915_000186 [Fasciola hepatica]|uniref:Uncharacterized protein n=1 Tax=Fasciola hepatica TaxID=6192 RepID=A0A4E0RMW2_FASHE|nr:hypothetical protein D915_000186 [Fasciola hepatica]